MVRPPPKFRLTKTVFPNTPLVGLVAFGINGTATAQNDATVTNAMGAAVPGNDIILAEDGNDVLAGDALASGLGGTATADNIAAVVGSGDGDINFLAPLVPGLPSDQIGRAHV